jgi:hypothetical protein
VVASISSKPSASGIKNSTIPNHPSPYYLGVTTHTAQKPY